jgi:hypothetical protein
MSSIVEEDQLASGTGGRAMAARRARSEERKHEVQPTTARRASSVCRGSSRKVSTLSKISFLSSQELVALDEDSELTGPLLAVHSDLRLERQRFAKVQERHQQWLKKALNQQVNDIEKEWDQVFKQRAEDSKREAILTQQRECAERVISAKKDIRDAHRESVAEKEKCLTSERREMFAERNRLEDEKMQALMLEKKRLQEIRRSSEVNHMQAYEAMREEIKQWRARADLDSSKYSISGLRVRIDEVCANLYITDSV